MSWSAVAYEGHAQDYEFQLGAPAEKPTGREGDVLDNIEEALPGLVQSLGDTFVAVTAYGHTSAEPQPGDVINVSITSIVEPVQPGEETVPGA